MEGWTNSVGIIFSKALAHGSEMPVTESIKPTLFDQPLDQLVSTYSLQGVYLAAILLGFLLFIAVVMRNPSETAKKIIFWLVTTIIVVTTGGLVGMTIYLNKVSVTGGPVHWHADYEVWACGEEQNLIDPEGASNKVGNSTIHEHNDNRIHIEGVLVDYNDANLATFFKQIGGNLTNSSMSFPAHHGTETFKTGQECGNKEAQLQAFAIEADLDNKVYSQHKIEDIPNFRFKHESSVPPGDCVIFEFDLPKERTDKMCQSYEVAIETGDLLTEIPQSQMEENGN